MTQTASETNKPLKVTLISHSDVLGGAGMVTFRLMHALRNEGVDARMVVYTKLSDDENVSLISTRFIRGIKFIWERLGIFLRNGFRREHLFKVSTANIGTDVSRHPWVKDADIVVMGWVNQGLMSLKSVKRLLKLDKPVVWTLHDMWNLTGICHHAYECRGFRRECGNCQFLSGNKAKDLSNKVWRKKKKLYESADITFVPVSHWLESRCRESSLMKGCDIRVIPNPFPAEYFTPEVKVTPERLYHFDARKYRIVICSARLDDPIKGLSYTVDALNYIFDNHPETASEITAVFIGGLRNPAALDSLRINHIRLGMVNDNQLLREIYASSHIVLSSSLYETLPGTLIEGQASGCIPVCFGRGGQDDIVEHGKTGYIAEYKDSVSLAKCIIEALNNPIDRELLHSNVKEKFGGEIISRQYIDLFNELLAKKKGNAHSDSSTPTSVEKSI